MLFSHFPPTLCPERLTHIDCLREHPCPLASNWKHWQEMGGRKDREVGSLILGSTPAGSQKVNDILLPKSTAPVMWPVPFSYSSRFPQQPFPVSLISLQHSLHSALRVLPLEVAPGNLTGAWIPCRCAFAPLSVCQINESVNESQSIKVARDPGDKTAQWLERWAHSAGLKLWLLHLPGEWRGASCLSSVSFNSLSLKWS